MIDGYICCECRRYKEPGSEFYNVLDTDGLYEACCSKKCAVIRKKRIVSKAKLLYTSVKYFKIDKDIW